MMQQYRKKPLVIYAVQFDGEGPGGAAFSQLFNAGLISEEYTYDKETRTMALHDGGHIMVVDETDWVILGVRGEWYPCTDEIFQATYEPVQPTI